MIQYAIMKKRVTEHQFTEAVYRHYYGEPLTSIAKDFVIGQSTLSELRQRRRVEWDRIRHRIIGSEIAGFHAPKFPPVDQQMRSCFTFLLKLLITSPTSDCLISAFCQEFDFSRAEAETYIQTFESLLPLKVIS